MFTPDGGIPLFLFSSLCLMEIAKFAKISMYYFLQ